MGLYRALLRLYPASFRAEYGEAMAEVFARRRGEGSGPAATLALWTGALCDTLVNAARVHADILRQDVRYTARTLRRSPGFTATIVLVAALGVGAVTAAFSITDHVLLRPLPFAEAGRLVNLWQDQSFRGASRLEVSPPNYRDWKQKSQSFEAMAAYHGSSVNLVGVGEPQRLEGSSVDADLFPMLGVRPALGRLFTAAEDRAGAAGTMILSDRLWRTRFGADPGVLGKSVRLDDQSHVIIGVLPRDFHFPNRDAEFWTPLRFGESDYEDRTNVYLRVVARLKRGVRIEQASAEMRLIAAQLERAYPKENARTGIAVLGLRDQISREARLLLLALLGASIGVLLIACTNLANLLIARALARRKELAVRTAMGAGRERLVRQLLTESLLVAAAGGLLGVLLALVAVPLAARLIPNSLPIAAAPSVDLRMLIFAAVLTAVTGIGFGVVPALRICGDADTSGLREGARTGADRRTERLRSMLVVAEVTTSVALLIGSGLLLRALWHLQSVDPGFRTEGVLTLRTSLPVPKYDPTVARNLFYTRVLTDIRTLPGVSSAGYISFLPMVMTGGIWPVGVAGQPEDPEQTRVASLRYVTPGLFAALGVRLLRGRDISDDDTGKAPFVAVVSDSFARRQWPGEDPLGKRFRIAFQDRTVVGVVGDVRVRGLDTESEPQAYLSSRQVDDGSIIWYRPQSLVVRSSTPAATLLPAIRGIVARADPQLPISDVRPLAEILDADTAPRQVQARVLGAFAAVAVLLAGIGIHGLLAFTVSHRLREIGVRMALGARVGDILKMVLRQGAVLAASGIVLGILVAYAAGRAMEALLAGVSPADATTFLAAIALAFAMTLAGSLLPALKAVRVSPMSVMRSE